MPACSIPCVECIHTVMTVHSQPSYCLTIQYHPLWFWVPDKPCLKISYMLWTSGLASHSCHCICMCDQSVPQIADAEIDQSWEPDLFKQWLQFHCNWAQLESWQVDHSDWSTLGNGSTLHISMGVPQNHHCGIVRYTPCMGGGCLKKHTNSRRVNRFDVALSTLKTKALALPEGFKTQDLSPVTTGSMWLSTFNKALTFHFNGK